MESHGNPIESIWNPMEGLWNPMKDDGPMALPLALPCTAIGLRVDLSAYQGFAKPGAWDLKSGRFQTFFPKQL